MGNKLTILKPISTNIMFQLTTNGQMTFPNETSCDDWLHMARPCYVAQAPPSNKEFTILPIWDWNPSRCQGVGKLLTSEWFHGSSISAVETQTSAFYDDTLPMRHQRCLANSGSVLCRPVIQSEGCEFGETRVCFVYFLNCHLIDF